MLKILIILEVHWITNYTIIEYYYFLSTPGPASPRCLELSAPDSKSFPQRARASSSTQWASSRVQLAAVPRSRRLTPRSPDPPTPPKRATPGSRHYFWSCRWGKMSWESESLGRSNSCFAGPILTFSAWLEWNCMGFIHLYAESTAIPFNMTDSILA